ncbi:MAG TPA: glycosyltransferase family A protein, partial [Candidatus Binataceae bacterium]
MAMTPEVSVVIPTHDRRAMVCEAVASVLAQRAVSPESIEPFELFELIVVDDGSTDGTFDNLSRLVAGRASGRAEPFPLIRIERIQHRGPAAARNRGVARARAPLIAFLDSDDLWAPAKLDRQLAFMRANPDCAIAQTQELWIRNGGRVNPGRRHRKRGGDIYIDSLRTCLISNSAVMIRTDLFRALGGFDETMAAAEDYDLWLRILVDHDAGLVDEYLVTRRAGHADQLSATMTAIDRYRILALAKMLADPKLGGEKREATAQVFAEKCGIYAKGLRRRGRADDARLYEQSAAHALAQWRLHPDDALASATASLRAVLEDERGGVGVPARRNGGQ